MLLKDSRDSNTGGQPTQNILDGDPHSPDTGFTTTFSWLQCDNLPEFHADFLVNIQIFSEMSRY
jgi:hypothetical protein